MRWRGQRGWRRYDPTSYAKRDTRGNIQHYRDRDGRQRDAQFQREPDCELTYLRGLSTNTLVNREPDWLKREMQKTLPARQNRAVLRRFGMGVLLSV